MTLARAWGLSPCGIYLITKIWLTIDHITEIKPKRPYIRRPYIRNPVYLSYELFIIMLGRRLSPSPQHNSTKKVPIVWYPLQHMSGRGRTIAEMIDNDRPLSVFATDGDQWQTPIWHENQWPVGCRAKKTKEDQPQPMFFTFSAAVRSSRAVF